MDEVIFTDKKFWRQLEALSLHYIASRINYVIPSTAELTPERKDGGFDGKIVINITDDSSVKHCILFESKFRTTIETLPLDDCSKALIIAFNRAAQTLFIVTNILFSDQAKKEIDNFKKKINLNVIEVDGIELKRYVKDNYLELNKICSEEFLQYILNVSSKSLNLKMDCHTALNQSRKIYSHDFPKKEEYICKNHKFYTALHQTEMAIQSGNAYIVLRGDGGIGKTVLLNEACQIPQNKGYSISTFQLRDYPSPRLLFIQLLGSLWNINLNEFIIRNNENSFLELIEMTQDGHIEQDLSDAVTRAIYSGSEKDCGFADNYHYLLVKFLYRILRPYKSFCKIIWCFSDLNKSTIDTLDFLSALFNKLIGIISIIVEVKPEFTLDTVPSNLIRKNYYKTFCLTSEYTHIVDIKGFDVDDAKTYLLHFLPGMTEEQVYLIIEKTGVLPLYLNIIATYISMMIKRLDIKPEFLPNYVLLNILQSFKQQENTLISESLRVYCEDQQMARCFAITGLLDGRLPLVLMEKLYDSSEVENLYNKLDNISCYAYDKDCYIVKHDFIFDAMRKVTSQRIRFQAAKLILEFNNENPLILSLTTVKRLELLFATNEYDKVLKIWFELVNELNYQHEYFSILNLSDVVLEAYDKTDFPERDPYVLERIISSILDTYIEVRILNDEKFIALMEKYETICNLHKYQKDGAEIRIRFLFYKWNQLFYGAEINSSYDVILEAKKLVDKNNIQDYDLCGRIYWAFALSHKRVSSIDEGIKDFEDGLGRYPDCILLYIGLTLHKAHLNLRRTPSATEQICRDLLNNVEGKKCPYHEILQIRVDIVMAEFYAKKYTDALKDCLEVLQIAQSINAAYQIGRLYNICGACELMNNAPEKAIMLFRKAQYEFHESGNSLFEWRVEFNISQINFRCGNEKKAMECFENIYRNGMPNLEERITDLTFDNIEVAAFLYTERIVKKSKQCKAGSKIVDLFIQNNIYKEIANLSDDKFQVLLEDYAYLHNGYFICLG